MDAPHGIHIEQGKSNNLKGLTKGLLGLWQGTTCVNTEILRRTWKLLVGPLQMIEEVEINFPCYTKLGTISSVSPARIWSTTSGDKISMSFLLPQLTPTSTLFFRALFACGIHFLPVLNLVHLWLASKLLWRNLLHHNFPPKFSIFISWFNVHSGNDSVTA